MISPLSAEYVEKHDLHSIVWTINGLLYDEIHYTEEFVDEDTTEPVVLDRFNVVDHIMTEDEKILFNKAVTFLEEMIPELSNDDLKFVYARCEYKKSALMELVKRNDPDAIDDYKWRVDSNNND